ncbi:Rho GTPase-activating protein gacZ [Ceratobasidium sp. AG-Ba]|nr:Rho GTPase-activating protein gacZ [Ceratobasidium sp. AG-Ba]
MSPSSAARKSNSRLSWRSSKLLVPGRLLPTSVFQPSPPPTSEKVEYWVPDVVWVPPGRRSDISARSSTTLSPVGTPLYDRLRSQTQVDLDDDMAIGQIRALPTPDSHLTSQGSNSSSSLGSGSAPTTTSATPTAVPRPLPILPPRSQPQLSLPLESQTQAVSRTTSRSPSPAPSQSTAGPVPTTGSVPRPPTAPNPTHPLPPLPPRPTLASPSVASSSSGLASTSTLTTLAPTPITPASAVATSGHGAPGMSGSDLINTSTSPSTIPKETDSGARSVPQVMVHAVPEASVRSIPPSPNLPPSSSSPVPSSPYLVSPGRDTSAPASPGIPPSPQSGGGASPHPSVSGHSPHSLTPSQTNGTGPQSPTPSGGGIAARLGKKKRQLSRDLLKRGGMSCEDLSILIGDAEGGDGEVLRMIPQHHKQTMALQHQRYPELAQDRNWGTQPQPQSQPPSSPTQASSRPPKLNLGLSNVFSSRSRKESQQGGNGTGTRRPSTPGSAAGFGFTPVEEGKEPPRRHSASLRKRGSSSALGALFGGSPAGKDKEKKPAPPSPPPKPAKLKAQNILGSALGLGMSVAGGVTRGSMMPNSPSIAAAIEYMRHEQEQNPRGSFSARRAVGTTATASEGHPTSEERHSESASDVSGPPSSYMSGPSSSVASLLSSGTGTGTSASEAVDAKILAYDADVSNVNTPQAAVQILSPGSTPPLFTNPDPFNPQARPHPPAIHDPDKRVSTASSQRTLMAWTNNKRESGVFVFPSTEHGAPLVRVHTTDGVSPTAENVPLPESDTSSRPMGRPARLGSLAGSLKRRSASMSMLIRGDLSDSSVPAVPPLPPRQAAPPLPRRPGPDQTTPRKITPTDGAVTDSEGYLSSASNAGGSSSGGVGRKWGQGGIKGKIAAWTAAAEGNGRRKHHPRATGSSSGYTDIEPRRSDSPHQAQAQGYPYSHSPSSAPTLQVHTHLHLPSHAHSQTPLMSIAALAPAARDLALGVGKRVEKFYRGRSASGAGNHGESHPMVRGGSQGVRVASPGSGLGTGLEPTLPPPIRPAIPGTSGLLFGRPIDDPGVVKDTDGWMDDGLGVKRCVGLPVFVSRCVRHLEKWGGDEEGLFRISGRPSHVSRLRAEFDAGADYDLSAIDPGDLDPHAVSSLFKAYLRELPDPILTRALKHQFDLAMTATSDTSSFDLTKLPTSMTSFGESAENMRTLDDSLLVDIKRLVDQLPQVNYVLLHELCHLLRYTADRAGTTKMPLGNLLLLFCPTLGFSASFLRCLVEGQEKLFEWGREGPTSLPSVPESAGPSQAVQLAASAPPALPPRKAAVSSSAGSISKHTPSVSAIPASVRSLKSPLNIATEIAQVIPRARSQTTTGTGSAPPSRASMFFPNLGPRRPSITKLFGSGNSNRNSRDATPRPSTSTSSEEGSWDGEDGTEEVLYVNPKRATRPPRVSLDIPDGTFAPSLSPTKSGIQETEQTPLAINRDPSPANRDPSQSKESPSARGAQTPIADLFKSPLSAAAPTIAPSVVTATGSSTLPPRLGLPFREDQSQGQVDEMGWGKGVLDAASASLGRR